MDWQILRWLIVLIALQNGIFAFRNGNNSNKTHFGTTKSSTTNRIVSSNTSCSSDNLYVTIQMEKPLKGIVFAKDFSQECKRLGTLEKSITIGLPTSGCGIRITSVKSESSDEDSISSMDPPDLEYSVTLVVQMDRHLRQIADQEISVSCRLDPKGSALNSSAMRQLIMNEMKDGRTGRMKADWTEKSNEIQALDQSRAWMEISSVRHEDERLTFPDESFEDSSIQVGELMKLTVKSTLPSHIGWKVIDCMAHDGIGDTSQKLIDDVGCPIDDQILPELTFLKPRMISTDPPTINHRLKRTVVKKTGEELAMKHHSDLDDSAEGEGMMMRYQEATASFPAFKFPDRNRLHLSCGLQLCKGNCQKIDCITMRRSSRHLANEAASEEDTISEIDFNEAKKVRVGPAALIKKPKQRSEVIDRLEVYNSVEVLAPEIELDDYRGQRHNKRIRPKLTTSSIPGDRTFCVSTNKMALAFCLLGVIFIIAVLVAIVSLLRARRKDCSTGSSGLGGGSRSYYSRSVFSSSASTQSAYGGSKLLLHESPCLSSARASSYPYVRQF